MHLPGISSFGHSHGRWGEMEKPLLSEEAQRDAVGRGVGCGPAQAPLPQVVDPHSLGSSQSWLDEALENLNPLQCPLSLSYSTWSLQAVTIWLRASTYGMPLRPPSARDGKSLFPAKPGGAARAGLADAAVGKRVGRRLKKVTLRLQFPNQREGTGCLNALQLKHSVLTVNGVCHKFSISFI